jgi:hypothetical protein
MKKPFKILSPTAILGYGFPEESFQRGLEEKPDLIAVDGGSTDPGPYYLGAGKSFTDRLGVKRDLRHMICAGVRNNIPVVIGTAGGAGAAPHLEWCHQIILEIAREEGLSFKLGLIPTDIEKTVVHSALDDGRIEALDFVPELTHADIDAAPHIVAQIGIEPFQQAILCGAQVVLAGRAYDPACFAALPILRGYDEGLALHCGKILECAAIAASPGSGSDCAMGIITEDSFILKSLSNDRRFTTESTAAHTLYEKSDPYFLPGPGGILNLTECSFTDIGDGMVEVKGSRHERSQPYRVKLEGSVPVGYRTVSIAGVRDPIMIASIESILQSVKARVDAIIGAEAKAQVHFHCYGKDGVMGPLEPQRNATVHELGIVLEVVGDTQEQANTICSLTRSTLLHFGYPGRVATAGNLAFPFSPSDIPAGVVYEFRLYHLIELPRDHTFPVIVENIGGDGELGCVC